MPKTIITLLVIALVWIGHIVWPLYELALMVRAIDERDLPTVTRHVNFDRVRVSLTEQVVAAYMRRSGIKPNLLAQQAVAAGTLPVVAARGAGEGVLWISACSSDLTGPLADRALCR